MSTEKQEYIFQDPGATSSFQDSARRKIASDTEKIKFYAIAYEEQRRVAKDCFDTLQVVKSRYDSLRFNIEEIANKLPNISEEKMNELDSDQKRMMDELARIKHALSLDGELVLSEDDPLSANIQNSKGQIVVFQDKTADWKHDTNSTTSRFLNQAKSLARLAMEKWKKVTLSAKHRVLETANKTLEQLTTGSKKMAGKVMRQANGFVQKKKNELLNAVQKKVWSVSDSIRNNLPLFDDEKVKVRKTIPPKNKQRHE